MQQGTLWREAANQLRVLVNSGAVTPQEAKALRRAAAHRALAKMGDDEAAAVMQAKLRLRAALRPVGGGDGLAEDVLIALAQYLARQMSTGKENYS